MFGDTYLVRVLGVHEDLLVLLEPGVHLAELELDEPVELGFIEVDGRSGFSATITDDDVVEVVLLGLEGVDEVLFGDVLGLEEVIGVVWLQPAGRGQRSDGVRAQR